MINRGALIWMVLAITAGTGLFLLKYEVRAMEEQLVQIKQQTLSNLEAVHVLKAEWSHLNHPTRLENLGRRLLSLEPVIARQIRQHCRYPPARRAGKARYGRPKSGRRRPCVSRDLPGGRSRSPPSCHVSTCAMTGRHPFFSRNSSRDLTVTADVELGRTRLLITSALFAAAFAVVAIRLVDVTLLGERKASHLAEGSGTVLHQVSRADIIDRNGILLATSLKTASLFANPRVIPDAGKAAARLVNILPDLDERKTRSRLGDDLHFVWIKRHLTPRQQYDVNRLGIPGLEFKNEERRIYPAGKLASHLLGHTDVDSNGQMGIERKFDGELKDRQTPLQLSLDTSIQHNLRRELLRSMAEFSAVGAAGIVMDVNNGEVLGMVSLPDFRSQSA